MGALDGIRVVDFGQWGKVWDEPAGPDALGGSPLQRLYRASDGWLLLGATAGQLSQLDALPGLGGIAALAGDALASALDARLARASVGEWVERLAAAGIGAQPVQAAARLMEDPWAIAHGLSVTREHADGTLITTIGPPARLSGTPVSPGRPVSAPGGDAAEILARVGLERRLRELIARGAVAVE